MRPNVRGTRDDAKLAEALRLVSLDDEHTKVPRHVEDAVMRAWDSRAPGDPLRHRRHSRHLALAALATAACAVLIVGFWFQRPPEDTAIAQAPAGAISNQDTRAIQTVAYSLDSLAATGVVLQEDPASLHVVRLTVQPSMLTASGYALADPTNTDPIDVEVLIGLDGVPRAIRRLDIDSDLEYQR